MESRSGSYTTTSTLSSTSPCSSSSDGPASSSSSSGRPEKSHGFDSGKRTIRLKERGLLGCPNVCGKGPFRTKEEVKEHKNNCPKEYIYNDYVKRFNQHESTFPVEPQRVTYERGATKATARRPIVGFVYTGKPKGAVFVKDMQ